MTLFLGRLGWTSASSDAAGCLWRRAVLSFYAAATASSNSSTIPRVLAGSIRTPGPIDVVRVIVRM
jgi:hypothetical protein